MRTVSIIVPVYKVEPYIRQCVDSVLNQTFPDFELILVDDGSPDNCGKICDEYAEKDSRISVIHKQNGGLSDARNAGLDVASGKYIYFLDGDDSIMPDLLEKAVARMDRGLDMVVFSFVNVYPDNHTTLGRCIEGEEYRLETPSQRLEFLHKKILNNEVGWEVWTRIFRRDLIQQKKLRFEDNRRIFAEDLYFTLCYCAHAVHVECMDEYLYRYSRRDDSIMGIQKNNNNIGRINELAKAVLTYYRQFKDCAEFVKEFPVLYMQIIGSQFINQMWSSGLSPLEFRKTTLHTVEDWAFLESQIKEALRRKNLTKLLGSVSHMLELKWHCQFLLGGSWTMLRSRCRLLRFGRPLLDAGSRKK